MTRIYKRSPNDDQLVLNIETEYEKWLKEVIGLSKDKKENWFITTMKVHSFAELKDKSVMETSIFKIWRDYRD